LHSNTPNLDVHSSHALLGFPLQMLVNQLEHSTVPGRALAFGAPGKLG
jgi:hypothetical protein